MLVCQMYVEDDFFVLKVPEFSPILGTEKFLWVSVGLEYLPKDIVNCGM